MASVGRHKPNRSDGEKPQRLTRMLATISNTVIMDNDDCVALDGHCRSRRPKTPRSAKEQRRRRGRSRLLATTSLFTLSLILFIVPSSARHYIAPGPCTWTHVAPVLRDIRFKSNSSPSPSAAALISVNSEPHSDFDVSLQCSVATLTPYTLNLSLIEPEHTVKLDIVCFGGDDSSGDRSTLRSAQSHHGLASFEHLHVLRTLSIDNCKLDRLPSESFRGLVALRNLTIRNAILSPVEPFTIEANSFQFVANHLEHLDLGVNRIETLPADLFCPFVHLHTLNLTGNHLPDLVSFGLIDPSTGRLCLQELQHLDLSHNRLEFVPETSGVAALKNLQTLNLSSNHISEIAELAFTALRRLHVLDLSGNRLRAVPGRMFRDSDELHHLRLASNGLAELPSGLFLGLSKLLILDLSDNQISSETLTSDTFADLIRVTSLDLSHNRLHRLTARTFQNQYSLQVLSLEGNQLETIEEGAFATLYNLHTLRLANNRFRHLPDSVLSGLFVLHQLHLAHSQLEHIHEDAFKNCSNLQILDLSHNRLTTLPVALKSLRNLRQLGLSTNQLATLSEPGPLAHTTSLEVLDLSDNYLTNVSRDSLQPVASTLRSLRLDGNRLRALEKNTLEDLRHTLRHLRLDRNELSDVSTSLADVKQLERLESLNVSHNRITWFDYALVPAALKVLDLSANRIELLGNYYELEAQVRLEDLDVSQNVIREISASSIPNSIRTLNLSSNRIEKVDQFAFVAKHNVTYVDIRNNSLRRIDNNAFRLGVQRPTSSYFLNRDTSEFDTKYLPPPIFLIAQNPFYCDCTMEWLQRVNQLVGGVTGTGAISTYPRIGDLELVMCELPFARQAKPATEATAAATTEVTIHVSLLQANSSNFLCRYRTHCFALCHCCEFDACDCEMMCPENCTCYYDQTWNTNIVDCSAANYRSVPARIPMDVTSLYLDGNNLITLTPHTFIGRKNLRILHLNNSHLETIANRSFNGLVYLEELHLEHNNLYTLGGYEFEALHYLTALHLDYNRISFIHERTFASLRSLQVLRLDHNQLVTFGPWFVANSLLATAAAHAVASSLVPQRLLSVSLSANVWQCQCESITTLYTTIRQVSTQLHITDSYDLRCLNQSHSYYLLRETKEDNPLLTRCNLTHWAIDRVEATAAVAATSESILDLRSPITTSSSSSSYPPEYNSNTTPRVMDRLPAQPPTSAEVGGFNRKDLVEASDEDDEDSISYQPIDLFSIRKNPNLNLTRVDGSQPSRAQVDHQRMSVLWLSVVSISLISLLLILGLIALKRKQDIQLWFYGRYGVRLFESGFCSCFGPRTGSSGDHRPRRSGESGFSDHFVKDSEKLFDAFVIYARPDESFVTQQLAAELECGYPPYRLCLRYRDLPAPASTTASTESNMPSKDHGYAFDAVTQAIECSRRTLVVISENFLQSDWCKFELKAAHQETLSSCKTHRLIVVIVPSMASHSPYQPVTKSAEMLLQRLDTETKTCIRGVTVLTWNERRFWEKLRFSMPPSSSGPVCSGDSVKGRTSTVVVTNTGYPTLAPSSLSSSSSLARSSVLYDTSQPIYYQHHYHYAQLPPSSNASLHKSSSLSIFGSKQPNVNPTATLSNRNPFNSKPLPPPPNQPLPPLPLVSSPHFLSNQHPHLDSMPPTYATCSELGEYEQHTAESALTSGQLATPQHSNTIQALARQQHLQHLRSPYQQQQQQQYFHSNRRAPL